MVYEIKKFSLEMNNFILNKSNRCKYILSIRNKTNQTEMQKRISIDTSLDFRDIYIVHIIIIFLDFVYTLLYFNFIKLIIFIIFDHDCFGALYT